MSEWEPVRTAEVVAVVKTDRGREDSHFESALVRVYELDGTFIPTFSRLDGSEYSEIPFDVPAGSTDPEETLRSAVFAVFERASR
jgi:hypothetical protein